MKVRKAALVFLTSYFQYFSSSHEQFKRQRKLPDEVVLQAELLQLVETFERVLSYGVQLTVVKIQLLEIVIERVFLNGRNIWSS